MNRRTTGRTTERSRDRERDPATEGTLRAPKEHDGGFDPSGLHEDDDFERFLDADPGDDDAITARPATMRPPPPNADPQDPDQLGAEALLRATGGGSVEGDDEPSPSLEDAVEADAIEREIVPRLVGQATLESASISSETRAEVHERRARARKGRKSARPPSPSA